MVFLFFFNQQFPSTPHTLTNYPRNNVKWFMFYQKFCRQGLISNARRDFCQNDVTILLFAMLVRVLTRSCHAHDEIWMTLYANVLRIKHYMCAVIHNDQPPVLLNKCDASETFFFFFFFKSPFNFVLYFPWLPLFSRQLPILEFV